MRLLIYLKFVRWSLFVWLVDGDDDEKKRGDEVVLFITPFFFASIP